MGYDMTYHPITREQIAHFYFEPLADRKLIAKRAKETDAPEIYKEIMEIAAKAAKNAPKDEGFNSLHGFLIGMMAGCLDKYWYIRGAAFSFLCDSAKAFAKYAADYSFFIPAGFSAGTAARFIECNSMSGAYIPHAGIAALKADLANPKNAKAIAERFSDGRLEVFIKALDHAESQGKDLFEMTDVVVPNPLSPGAFEWNTYAKNLQPEGYYLYLKAVKDQLAELQRRDAADAKGRKAAPSRRTKTAVGKKASPKKKRAAGKRKAVPAKKAAKPAPARKAKKARKK